VYICPIKQQQNNIHMTIQMYQSRRNAIATAKKQLMSMNNISAASVSRHHVIKTTTCSCACGESLALRVQLIHDWFYNAEENQITVGICNSCGI
jgi:hypothetical protein